LLIAFEKSTFLDIVSVQKEIKNIDIQIFLTFFSGFSDPSVGVGSEDKQSSQVAEHSGKHIHILKLYNYNEIVMKIV
jgi:hypothetical protein